MNTKFKVGDIVKIVDIWLSEEMLKDDETDKGFKKNIGKIGKIIEVNTLFSETNRYAYIIENIDNSWNWREIRKITKQELENYNRKQVIEKL